MANERILIVEDERVSVARKMGTSRSCPQGSPYSGCPVTCRTKWPFLRSCKSWPPRGRLTGSPQRTNGLGTEAEFLILLLPADADQFDPAHLLELLARNEQLRLLVTKQIADGLERGPATLAGG